MADALISPHAGAEEVVFVGEAASGARRLARALVRIGYATSEASSVAEIGGARPPAAIVVPAHDGVDPFRSVRAVRARSRLAHSLVFAWSPAGFEAPIGVAVAAGADDIVGERSTIEECLDRIAGRLTRRRTLHERATFDCMTQIRGRLFVAEWLSAEIGLAVADGVKASFAVVWLSGFADERKRRGLFSVERDVERAALALATAVRPCDLPCRLTDDTFVVLLPGAGAKDAAVVMDHARARMTEKTGAMAVVVGLAEAPADGMTWQVLFERAEARRDGAAPREPTDPRRQAPTPTNGV